MTNNAYFNSYDRRQKKERSKDVNQHESQFSRTVLLCFGLATCGFASTASAQNCPNLTGHWATGSGGGMSMDIRESDCKLASDNADSAIGFHHTLRGEWDPAQYNFRVVFARLDPQHCWTHLYGRATVTGPSAFNVEITSTEGRCGLPVNFRDHGTYTRQ